MLKILVINMARFGDLIQTIPMIMGLRKKFPGCYISLMVNSEFSDICSIIPGVDDFIELDFKKVVEKIIDGSGSLEDPYIYLEDFFSRIKKSRFDKIINVTPHDIGVVSSFLASDLDLWKKNLSDWSLYYLNITRNWNILEFNLTDLLLKIAGLEVEQILPRVVISREAEVFARGFLHDRGYKKDRVLIGFNPGASTEEKQWPLEYFVELAELIKRSLNAQILILGSRKEQELAEVMVARSDGCLMNAAGMTDFSGLAALINMTDVIVTNDTVAMHVAAGCDTKIISLHMGKEKCLSTGPYGSGHIALESGMLCHPCKNPEKCHGKPCRYSISPQTVFEILKDIIVAESVTKDSIHISEPPDTVDGYVSVFDMFGFQDIVPLWNNEVKCSVLCTRFFRHVWNICLAPDFEITGKGSKISIAVNTIIDLVKYQYNIQDMNRLFSDWQQICKKTEELRTLSVEGQDLCIELNGYSNKTIDNLPEIKDISNMIEIVDEKIISLAKSAGDLVSLSAMFCFDKENMHGDDLLKLTEQTKEIYKKLQIRCEVFWEIGTLFFENINSKIYENKKIA